ncbi:uncharacterized protein [Dermacentor albipictus]|uniref:uncharacterized protein n=1 Tax=Dermacentor albipictus TaxID=60249 RepID=UPI0038FC0BD6
MLSHSHTSRKTCLLIVSSKDTYPGAYVPTVFENYATSIKVDCKLVELALTVVTTDTDVIIMCFSIDSPDSLKNNPESRRPEVRHFCSSVCIVLAGTERPAHAIGDAKASQRRQEDHDRLRPLSYPVKDVIIMRFSIDSADSLENNPESGRPEVRHFCSSVCIVLAGTERPAHAIGDAKASQRRQENHDRLRPLSYPVKDVIIMRFVIDSADSLENNPESGRPEVRHFCSSVCIVLAGTERPAHAIGDAKACQRRQEDHDRLRPLSYLVKDVIIMRFVIDSADSLENNPVSGRPEVRHFCSSVCIVLAGTERPAHAIGDAKASQRRQEDHDRLRPLSYPVKDVIIMRFVIDSADSLENNPESGRPEVRHFCLSVFIVLAGTERPAHAIGDAKASQRRQEDHDRLRPLSYPDKDVIIMRFSIHMPDSLENNPESGRPEVRHFCLSVYIVLAGTERPAHAIGDAKANQRRQEDHDRLRPLSYPDKDIIIMRFSIHTPDSLENNPESGRPEVHHLCLSVYIVLAGTERPAYAIGDAKASQRRQEDYVRLRPLSYPVKDVIIMRFSIDSADSLENNPESGRPEVRHFCLSVCIILAGTERRVHAIGNTKASQRWQEDHDRLRPLSYPDKDVIIMRFSIDSADSLENNPESGRPEVHHLCLSVYIVLAGTERPAYAIGDAKASQRRQEDYVRLRPLSYSVKDVIIMRFSIDSADSLENNPESGRPEVRHFCLSVCIILAGTERRVHAIGNTKASQRWQEDHDRLRPLSYPDKDVIMMCFSIDSPDSLENNPESGRPEGLHFCLSLSIVLAGTERRVHAVGKTKANQRWQEDHDRLRPLSYPDKGVLIMCFSIDSSDSLKNNPESVKPEVRHFCPSVYIALAGTERRVHAIGNTKASQRWQEDHDRLRPLSYPDKDVIMMCFSIDSPDSLENNPESGRPEGLHFCLSLSIVLAGTERPAHAIGDAKASQRRQEDHDQLRPLSYPDKGVTIMCSSIDAPDSPENNPESGTPEVRHFCPSVPIILAGNKKDLRNDPDTPLELAKMKKKPVAPGEGRTMADAPMPIWLHLECSAKTKDGVRDVFLDCQDGCLRCQDAE